YVGRLTAPPARRWRRLDSGQLRPEDQLDLLVHRTAQAVGTGIPWHGWGGALHEQHARARSRYGPYRLVSPVHSRREPRFRRGVRKPAHRPRRAAIALQDREAW